MTHQDTQPPAETLAEAMHCALKDAAAIATAEADRLAKEMPMGSRSEGTARAIAADITRLAVAALTRRAGDDAIPAGVSAVMGRILGHYGEDPSTLARIKGMVAQYREAPFRSADWLAGEIMRILDSEPANDITPKPPAGGDAGAVGIDRATLMHCARVIRDRAVTVSSAPLGGGYVSEAGKIAARHLITAAEDMDKEAAALALPAPVVEGAHLAAFHALHGAEADPFENPEAFEFCGKIADAVLAALSEGRSHG